MTMLPKLIAAAALGAAVFAISPAAAQGWDNYGYNYGWRSDYYGPGGNYPSWGVQNGPRTDILGWNGNYSGYNGYNYGVANGAGELAICPAGYHLGPNGALCWPN